MRTVVLDVHTGEPVTAWAVAFGYAAPVVAQAVTVVFPPDGGPMEPVLVLTVDPRASTLLPPLPPEVFR